MVYPEEDRYICILLAKLHNNRYASYNVHLQLHIIKQGCLSPE